MACLTFSALSSPTLFSFLTDRQNSAEGHPGCKVLKPQLVITILDRLQQTISFVVETTGEQRKHFVPQRLFLSVRSLTCNSVPCRQHSTVCWTSSAGRHSVLLNRESSLMGICSMSVCIFALPFNRSLSHLLFSVIDFHISPSLFIAETHNISA